MQVQLRNARLRSLEFSIVLWRKLCGWGRVFLLLAALQADGAVLRHSGVLFPAGTVLEGSLWVCSLSDRVSRSISPLNADNKLY